MATDLNKESQSCEKSTNVMFDIGAAIISISDIITDVMVTYGFYQHNRMLFFGLSLTFICLAQLSYVFAFIVVIGKEDKPLRVFLMLLLLLPISPVLSFVFYFTDDPDSLVSTLLEKYFCFDVSFSQTYVNQNDSKLKQWMEKKLRKHLGFIMEACIEAFPQSIVQLSAIVIYKEANIIAIVSVLISMLSVSSKAFIFSINFSSNIKTLLFNWLSAVTDFVGIFFFITWSFYDTDNHIISLMGTIWKFKVLITVVPLTFGVSTFVFYEGLRGLINNINDNSWIAFVFGCCCSVLAVVILWAFGMILGTLALEIATFILFAAPVVLLQVKRLPENAKKNKIWMNILDWIKQYDKQSVDNILSLTKKQDKIIRICCVNKTIIEKKPGGNWDPIFVEYIKNSENNSSFRDITSLSQLRTAHAKADYNNQGTDYEPPPEFGLIFVALLVVPFILARSEYVNAKKYHWSHEKKKRIVMYGVGFLNFFVAPFYYLSRIFNMLYPIIILITLFIINGYNDLFYGIDTFQMVMLILYLSFILILFSIGIYVYYEFYLFWHIMPLRFGLDSTNITLQLVKRKYNSIITVPVRNALLKAKYGIDIANIIIYYCNQIKIG